jgi:peptidoglycan/xylan/chitin deacetylase (PgdA/CDA1 family)
MKLSMVAYHYVRELRNSRFPEIKGLDLDQFRGQIAYIRRHYRPIGGDDLLAAAEAQSWKTLPPRALLLTFDDGYLDHFTQVLPILRREKLPACFFPLAKCVLGDQVLDVNKIHFVLASVPNKQAIVDYIMRMVNEYGPQHHAQSASHYWTKLAVANRFDPKEVVFIKRALQRELPDGLRRLIVDDLFQTYVTSDEASFARELYMSVDHLTCLRDHGMYIGSHGYGHSWLNCGDPAKQRREIELSIKFLAQIGTRTDRWIMCYPYGAYDDTLLATLTDTGCKIGLTTRVAIADLERDCLLALPRLDTNDLPKSANAAPNAWTLQA